MMYSPDGYITQGRNIALISHGKPRDGPGGQKVKQEREEIGLGGKHMLKIIFSFLA